MPASDEDGLVGPAQEISDFLFDKRNRLASELSLARLAIVDDRPQYRELDAFGEHTLEVWDDATALIRDTIKEPNDKAAVIKRLNNFIESSTGWLSAHDECPFFLDSSRAIHSEDGVDFRENLFISSWVDVLGLLVQTLYEYLATDGGEEDEDGSRRYGFDFEAIACDPALTLRIFGALNEWTTGEEFTADRGRAWLAGETSDVSFYLQRVHPATPHRVSSNSNETRHR